MVPEQLSQKRRLPARARSPKSSARATENLKHLDARVYRARKRATHSLIWRTSFQRERLRKRLRKRTRLRNRLRKRPGCENGCENGCESGPGCENGCESGPAAKTVAKTAAKVGPAVASHLYHKTRPWPTIFVIKPGPGQLSLS